MLACFTLYEDFQHYKKGSTFVTGVSDYMQVSIHRKMDDPNSSMGTVPSLLVGESKVKINTGSTVILGDGTGEKMVCI